MLTHRLSRFLGFALLCACVGWPVAHTQTPSARPPQFFQMTVYRNLRPGYADFLQRELNPALSESGVRNLFVWSTALGDRQELITLQPQTDAQAFEQFIEQEHGQERGQPLAARLLRFAQFYEERLAYVIVTRPELSAQLPARWPRLVRLRITTTAPQRDDEFAQWLQRELLPRAAQNAAATEWPTEWIAKLRYGGDVNNTFLSWRMSERFGDLDAAFDQQADTQLQAAGVVACNTDYWLRYRPDLSIVNGKAAVSAQ